MSCNRRHFLLSIQLLSLVSFPQDYVTDYTTNWFRFPWNEKPTNHSLSSFYLLILRLLLLECLSWNILFKFLVGTFEWFPGQALSSRVVLIVWYESQSRVNLCEFDSPVYCFIIGSQGSWRSMPYPISEKYSELLLQWKPVFQNRSIDSTKRTSISNEVVVDANWL